mgnify:CR=1 FL=1
MMRRSAEMLIDVEKIMRLLMILAMVVSVLGLGFGLTIQAGNSMHQAISYLVTGFSGLCLIISAAAFAGLGHLEAIAIESGRMRRMMEAEAARKAS